MFEGGNISGLLGMSNKSDGTGEAQGSYGGNYAQRRKSVRNHYIKTGYRAHKGMNIDPETGEVLDYVPPKNTKNPYKKMAYSKKTYYKGNPFKLPNLDPSSVINLAMCAAIGYGGYILYSKVLKPLGNTPMEDAEDKADKKTAGAYVSTAASQVDSLSVLKSNLSKQGLNVSQIHTANADSLHNMLNSVLVDHNKVVLTIQGMTKQTFQLVDVAYGYRDLNTYRNNLTHIFNPAVWSDLFSSNKLLGTLKNHLETVLTSDEQKKISQWLGVIY